MRSIMMFINGMMVVALVGGFLYSIYSGYSPTPTDMVSLAVLNAIIFYGNKKDEFDK
jgi:hypothetical protein